MPKPDFIGPHSDDPHVRQLTVAAASVLQPSIGLLLATHGPGPTLNALASLLVSTSLPLYGKAAVRGHFAMFAGLVDDAAQRLEDAGVTVPETDADQAEERGENTIGFDIQIEPETQATFMSLLRAKHDGNLPVELDERVTGAIESPDRLVSVAASCCEVGAVLIAITPSPLCLELAAAIEAAAGGETPAE